ncbi:hypothetical protein C8J56DRAFT_934880 [Mycena floridula]|nr:hypothetical protein C8J56DRAFT_934880 [Mycena floridula]
MPKPNFFSWGKKQRKPSEDPSSKLALQAMPDPLVHRPDEDADNMHSQFRLATLPQSRRTSAFYKPSGSLGYFANESTPDIQRPHASPTNSKSHAPRVRPRRPPRPPSLYDSSTDSELFSLPPPPKRHISTPSDESFESTRRRPVPELDTHWENFLKDVDEDPQSLQMQPSPINGSHTKNSSHLLYRTHGRSTPHLPLSDNVSLRPRHRTKFDEDLEKALSSFPLPPGSGGTMKKIPNPLVLRPTPSIATLPPSPISSHDSTPITTPTSPNHPASVLKKPSGYFNTIRGSSQALNYLDSQSTTCLAGSIFNPPGRLRHHISTYSFESSPLSSMHRPTLSGSSSASTSTSSLSSRSKHLPPLPSEHKAQLEASVQWGYAV